MPKFTRAKAISEIKIYVDNVSKHDLLTLAGALAFNTALSLAPLVLIFLTVASLIGHAAQEQLVNQVRIFLGEQAAAAIRLVVDNAKSRPTLGSIAGAFGVLILLISASSVFAQLQSSLNVIWETDPAASGGVWAWLRKRVLSMGMVIAIGFIGAVSLIVSSVLSFIANGDSGFLSLLNGAVSIAVFSLLFALIFAYLPDRHQPFKKSLFGGFLTSLLFSIGKFLIGIYIGQSAVSSSYGAAGSIVVILIWVYYSSFIVFAGAELTRQITTETSPKDALEKPQAPESPREIRHAKPLPTN